MGDFVVRVYTCIHVCMCNMFMFMYMYVRVVIEVAFNYVCLMHVLLNKLEDT